MPPGAPPPNITGGAADARSRAEARLEARLGGNVVSTGGGGASRSSGASPQTQLIIAALIGLAGYLVLKR